MLITIYSCSFFHSVSKAGGYSHAEITFLRPQINYFGIHVVFMPIAIEVTLLSCIS